jgi:hypothetical protein
MTINILLIPAISAKLERVFSRAYYIITWDKGQIVLETIE